MYPKYHILIGAILSLILLLFSPIPVAGIIIFFISSFIFDIDHYLFYLNREKDFNLKKAFYWHKKFREENKFHKPLIHILHTIEFHIFLLILAFYFSFFKYVLIGVSFHSFIDLIDLIYAKRIHVREYFLTRYLLSDKKKYF